MAQALDATVVKVDVRDFDFGRQAVRLDCEAMIMRSNLDVAVTRILDRLIAAAMSENDCFTSSTSLVIDAGSPGPLERKTPSGFIANTSLA